MADLASRITKPTDGESSAAEAQMDGAVETLGGSGLVEPEYEVQVKLSELQEDSSTPFYSAKTFEEMNLSVCAKVGPSNLV
jgi:ATP-dependent RNA helicase DDX19/DBP5